MSLEDDISDSCKVILDNVRSSFLNFSSTETPYSLYLTIRKSRMKSYKLGETSAQNEKVPVLAASTVDRATHEYLLKVKEDENNQLKKDLDASKDQNKLYEAKIQNLEVKVAKGEKEILYSREALGKKVSDTEALNLVIKNNKFENDRLSADIKHLKKVIKAEEKTVYNLENFKLNHQDKIKTLKADTIKLKAEKAELEKKLRILEKKSNSKISVIKEKQKPNSEAEKILLKNNSTTLNNSITTSQDMSSSMIRSSPSAADPVNKEVDSSNNEIILLDTAKPSPLGVESDNLKKAFNEAHTKSNESQVKLQKIIDDWVRERIDEG